MKRIRHRRTTIILFLVFALGIGLILYPSFSDWWNSFHQTRAIMNYAAEVDRMDTSEYDRLIEEARRYNEDLAHTGINWNMTEEELDRYEHTLRFNDSGNMGYIDIPKIKVSLPLYHGVGENMLQTSIGHLEGTSLPVGGEGTHCILSGHRGLPSARLFTDLDKLVEGDTWTLTILNETLSYECDQIRVVEPTDVSDLKILPGKDYCTLLTCTPYGINTHRLLVRGHRIENAQGEAKVVADAVMIESAYAAPFFAVPILLMLMLLLLIPGKNKSEKMS